MDGAVEPSENIVTQKKPLKEPKKVFIPIAILIISLVFFVFSFSLDVYAYDRSYNLPSPFMADNPASDYRILNILDTDELYLLYFGMLLHLINLFLAIVYRSSFIIGVIEFVTLYQVVLAMQTFLLQEQQVAARLYTNSEAYFFFVLAWAMILIAPIADGKLNRTVRNPFKTKRT